MPENVRATVNPGGVVRLDGHTYFFDEKQLSYGGELDGLTCIFVLPEPDGSYIQLVGLDEPSKASMNSKRYCDKVTHQAPLLYEEAYYLVEHLKLLG